MSDWVNERIGEIDVQWMSFQRHGSSQWHQWNVQRRISRNNDLKWRIDIISKRKFIGLLIGKCKFCQEDIFSRLSVKYHVWARFAVWLTCSKFVSISSNHYQWIGNSMVSEFAHRLRNLTEHSRAFVRFFPLRFSKNYRERISISLGW